MLSRFAMRPWALARTMKPVATSSHTIPRIPSLLPRLNQNQPSSARQFSTSPVSQSWLAPRRGHKGKTRKGRPRVRTGGSTAGTSMLWGDYGLRMCDHDRRVSARQLEIGWNTIRQRLRGMKYRMIPRVAADRAVFKSGNEQRMGKGKGSFDHYASRVSVNHMIFELRGDIHEKVVRDAFRLASAKMPGQYEFVKKGDPPVMGLTKVMAGMTLESIRRPWAAVEGVVEEASLAPPAAAAPPPPSATDRTPPAPKEPLETTADRLPSATPP